jgi:hypothetical protein
MKQKNYKTEFSFRNFLFSILFALFAKSMLDVLVKAVKRKAEIKHSRAFEHAAHTKRREDVREIQKIL